MEKQQVTFPTPATVVGTLRPDTTFWLLLRTANIWRANKYLNHSCQIRRAVQSADQPIPLFVILAKKKAPYQHLRLWYHWGSWIKTCTNVPFTWRCNESLYYCMSNYGINTDFLICSFRRLTGRVIFHKFCLIVLYCIFMDVILL